MDKFGLSLWTDWKRPIRYSGITLISLDAEWGFDESARKGGSWMSVTAGIIGFHAGFTYWPKGKYA